MSMFMSILWSKTQPKTQLIKLNQCKCSDNSADVILLTDSMLRKQGRGDFFSLLFPFLNQTI